MTTPTYGCDSRHRYSGQRPVVCLTKHMTWRFKLVAAALAVTTLAMPMSAMTSCWWHMSAAEKCKPHCPMMSGHEPSPSIQEVPGNGSCCQVSAAKPTPASVPQAPTGSGPLGVAPSLNVSTLDAPIAPIETSPPDPLARASCPSLQSVFCTFLI